MTSTTTTPGGSASATTRRRRPRPSWNRISFMLVFLVLPLAIFLVFVISPFVQALYYSMTDWTGFSPNMNFVGLSNFVKLAHDDIFLHALRNNVLLAIVVPLFTIVVALAVATMVTVGGPSKGTIRGIRGSSFYRVVSFFPYTVPAIVIGLIWEQVYDPATGLLNGFLTGIGLHGFDNFAWLGEVRTAMPASMWVIIWSFIGFYTVLFVAAIKGVPAEMYEAARIDGAGRFRMAMSLTIPAIRDNVQTAYIYLGIAALDAFVYMQAMNPGGGPNNTTLTMSQELFTVAFRKGQFGYATSMGVVLAAVTLLFAAIVFTVNRLTGGGDEARSRRRRRKEARA
jgi:N-acetylglucosamine transport system permease protein